jgi:hypothetical protein
MASVADFYPSIQFTADSNGWASGGIVSGSISKGGKPVASKDDVVEAFYRLNPGLKDKFKNQEEFVAALIAAGEDAFRRQSVDKLAGISFNF